MRAYRAEFVQIGRDIEPMMALDHERGHYQFFWYGWQNDRHIFSVAFHAQLRDRKVWMLQDKTEEGFANYLVPCQLISDG